MALATLSIDIVAKLANIERDMNRFADLTQKNMSKIGSAIKGIVPAIAAVTSASAGFDKLLSSQRQFDVLNAGLVTATGSADAAADAFESLQGFASKTPYDLAQTTEAFTKLVNLGLTPSERALTAFGNTAAAMGKDLSQLVEAVADATTGEFERLKEFGIKAKQEGDKVALTFRGVTTNIGNNAKEIENYLISIGENDFGGAMERRMQSLDGLISNLGDEWDKLFLNISQQGVGTAISDGVQVGIDALTELNAMVASGELAAYVEAYGDVWESVGNDIRVSMSVTADFISDVFKATGGEGKTAMGVVFETISALSANVLYVLKGIGTEIGGIAAQISAVMSGDFDQAAFIGEAMKEDAAQARAEIDALTESILNSGTASEAAASASSAAWEASIAKAHTLRAEYDKTHATQAASEDTLAKYKVATTGQMTAAQTKLMDEYRKAEEKKTLSASEFAIKEAQREAQAKLAIAGSNVELQQKIEQDLAAKIQAIHNGAIANRADSEKEVTAIVRSEAAARVSIERQTASEVAAVWSQANAVKASQTGGVIMNQGGPGEFVSSWDANGNYVGDLGTSSSTPRGYATGGSFMVGGSGGTDSQLVTFRASPDERVTIETPAQQRASGGGVTVNVNVANGNPQSIIAAIKQALRVDPGLFSTGAVRAG